MSNFAFSSPRELIWFPVFALTLVLWIPLWNLEKQKRNKSSSKKIENLIFWRFWIWEINPVSRICNWYVLTVFIMKVFQLICTIIYGFAPGK